MCWVTVTTQARSSKSTTWTASSRTLSSTVSTLLRALLTDTTTTKSMWTLPWTLVALRKSWPSNRVSTIISSSSNSQWTSTRFPSLDRRHSRNSLRKTWRRWDRIQPPKLVVTIAHNRYNFSNSSSRIWMWEMKKTTGHRRKSFSEESLTKPRLALQQRSITIMSIISMIRRRTRDRALNSLRSLLQDLADSQN